MFVVWRAGTRNPGSEKGAVGRPAWGNHKQEGKRNQEGNHDQEGNHKGCPYRGLRLCRAVIGDIPLTPGSAPEAGDKPSGQEAGDKPPRYGR